MRNPIPKAYTLREALMTVAVVAFTAASVSAFGHGSEPVGRGFVVAVADGGAGR